MWKSVDEITAYNQSAGRSTTHDPFEAANTLLVTVEGITLEGDHVVLATCCESARLARADVLAWREAQTPDHQTIVEVRLRRGAPVLAQRAAVADDNEPCPRCGRGWDGLPPVRGEQRRDEGQGCEPRHEHGGHDHAHHGGHGGGPHEHGEHFGPHHEHGHHHGHRDDHRHDHGDDREAHDRRD